MDRINASGSAGSFPINAALRAYSQSPRINKPGGSPFVKSVQPMRPIAPATTIQPIRQPITPDTVGKIAPKQSALESSSIDQLVAGKVDPIDLVHDVAKVTGPKPMTTSAGTYTMYPRSADRNQAATNVAVGRSLDLRG
jgi:hypothetical protein